VVRSCPSRWGVHTFPKALAVTFSVHGAPASLIEPELLRSGLRPFALPRPDAAGLSYVHQGHESANSVHKKHNTRRYGHPLFGGPGRPGRGYGPLSRRT
jgi:hypothetical protein